MNVKRAKEILARIKKARIAIYGDFCLDAYWALNPRGSEISVETGIPAQAVSKQSYSLGGASNIAANLAALEPSQIHVIGAIGDDIFGRELARQLTKLGVDAKWLVVQKENFDTVTFCKPYLVGEEQSRIDFGFFNQRTESTDDILLEGLRMALETADVIVLSQQVPGSIANESFIDDVNALVKAFPEKIVLLDSRHYGGRFTNVHRKTNEVEAALLNGIKVSPEDVLGLADVQRCAKALYQKSGKPIFVTRGARGMVVHDAKGSYEIPGVHLLNRLDPVGAGDTTISGLACCLAAGLGPVEAAEFANLAAAVTVQKLFQTGTASGSEILELAESAVYICQPELAEDIGQARYLESSEIEICCDLESMPGGRTSHVLFDHDGTISILREGWEAVMEQVMVKAILGEHHETAGETLVQRIRNRVREYIDHSTGIQTILQMEELVKMVQEFGMVRSENILDKAGYKKTYNDALMNIVNQRLTKLKTGKLDEASFTLRDAVPFLRSLREKNVTLYLASGTDEEDVVREANALGYAEFFGGGIYGAVGDVKKYSKKIVFERIIRRNKLNGPELVCFGDGPVEMRECRRQGGIAIGIASDETRGHGLNVEKRKRLIKAGAHFVMPDFSQGDTILELLFRGQS
ncbi:MAG: PfkB family carbohydrate kinase [bacterium]